MYKNTEEQLNGIPRAHFTREDVLSDEELKELKEIEAKISGQAISSKLNEKTPVTFRLFELLTKAQRRLDLLRELEAKGRIIPTRSGGSMTIR